MSRPGGPVEPDHFTQTALRLLPVPPHRETFWDDLDRALDGRPAAAATTAGAEPDRTDRLQAQALAQIELAVDDALALVPPALRRRSNAVVVAVAAAAVVVVVLAGGSLVRERSGGDQLPLAGAGGGAEPSDALDALVNDAHPASATPVTLSTGNEAASSDAVIAWVDAVHMGDADAAWQAMGPASQDHFGSQAAFEQQLSGVDSGFGRWSEVDLEDVLITPVVSSDESTVAVVTLVGTTEIDGEAQHRADAFPVRIIDGDAVLEPFALAGALELVVPEPVAADGTRPPVEDGEGLVVVVPEGVDAPILRLDDGDTVVCGQAEGTELRAMDGLPTQRCSYLPTEGITSGEHTLTVAFVGANGSSISAEALLFQAA